MIGFAAVAVLDDRLSKECRCTYLGKQPRFRPVANRRSDWGEIRRSPWWFVAQGNGTRNEALADPSELLTDWE